MSDAARARPDERFRKGERIRARDDIDAVFSGGTRHSVKGLRLHALRNASGQNRAVFVPVKAFGGSVPRKRARRIVSEAYRLAKARLSRGWDFVFVIYPGFDSFETRRNQVESVLAMAGALPRTR